MSTEVVTNKRQLDNDVAEWRRENGVGVREDSQLLFGDKSPLLNPVILTRLFEICELSQLLNFRLVSKQWYSLSLTPFREEMLVTIHPHKWRQRQLLFQKSPKEIDELFQWQTLGDQLELDFRAKPFRCYRIYEMYFSSEPSPPIPLNLRMRGSVDVGHPEEISRNFNPFWGRNIRQLDLQTPLVSSREVFRKIIFDRMPNLEKLRLHNVLSNGSSRDDNEDVVAGKPHLNLKHVMVKALTDLPCSWKLFRAHFPKIQKLEIRSAVTVTDLPEHDVDAQLIEAIGKHKQTPEITIAKLTLQRLSEDTIPKINLFLQIPSLKVQSLRINFDIFEDKGQDLLSRVFLHVGRTLQELAVRTSLDSARFRPCEDFPCQSGPFHALTRLCIEPHLIGNLHFLGKFPNLVTLSLFQMEEQDRILEGTDFTRLVNVSLLNLRKFEFIGFPEQTFGISEEVMNVLVKLMPNLEIFKGQLSNSSLRVLFQNWRNLRELVVTACTDGAIDDAGIIGIVAGEEEEQLPNIADLQSLEVLSLSEVEVNREATVWDGFLKIPSLRELCVTLRPEISDDAFNALREKFGSGVTRGPY